jgi:hypothetical protein
VIILEDDERKKADEMRRKSLGEQIKKMQQLAKPRT